MFSFAPDDSKYLIVFDLEWNQSSYNPNHRMPHEIIEIGACRVDRNYRVVDTFSEVIRPKLYKKLDKHIKSVTGITEDELAQGRAFSDVFGDFMHWCGNDENVFVTWSTSDIVVILNNLKFYRMPLKVEKMASYCNIQPYVQKKLGFEGTQMALSAAAEQLGINCEYAEFHRALDDSVVTALISSRCYFLHFLL